MNVFQSFLIALDMLRMHKLRAFLTMLGVIIGVMAVTIIVMVSSGFQSFLSSQFNKLGGDTVMIFFDPGRRERDTLGKTEGLRLDDMDFLMQRVQELQLATPIMQVPSQNASYEGETIDNPRIYATDDHYAQLQRLDLKLGRWISAGDVAERANVCLVGEDIMARLFHNQSPQGKYLTLQGITLEVIGVFKRQDFFGQTNADDVLLPVSTAEDKWTGSKNLMMIMARPKPGVSTQLAEDRIWEALMIRSGNRPLYRVDSSDSILSVMGAVLSVTAMILASIAALSLLVGGIGIMNIMLVSVTERTKEIGLRKAIGARRSSILIQFVVEAATLSLVGGLIGMGIAWLIGSSVTLITAANKWPNEGGLPTPFPITAALLSAAFSALIGVIFGLYPAISAARLDPIVALRRE